MTNRLERRNYGRGHGYKIDGRKVIGVTTAIDVLDKPALRQWYANEAAARAVDEADHIAALPLSERFDYIKFGPRDRVRKASIRGTEIHALGYQLAQGRQVEVPAEHVGPVEAYARFLDEWDVEVLAAETPLAHDQYGYGGTADLWAVIHRLGGERVALDVKTGKGVYPEVQLQLTAYRHATIWHPDGELTPQQRQENVKRKRRGEDPIEPREEPMPEWDGAYVAHVLPDDVRLVPVHTDEQSLLEFRWCQGLARRQDRVQDDSPIGAPMRVEEYPDERQEKPA